MNRAVTVEGLDPMWFLRFDDERRQDRFLAIARQKPPERTRVELEHRNIDRHGEGWEATRDAVGGDQGWPLYLERFAELVN